MADGNALIAALRGATPAPLRQAQGPQALSYPWMSRSEGPLVIPTRKIPSVQTPPVVPTPSVPTPSVPTPSVPKPTQPVYTPPTEIDVGVYGIPNQPVQQTDWDKLNADYAAQYNQALQSGMTEEQWAKTPVFENWKQTVLNAVGNTQDVNKLTSDINALQKGGVDNPIYGDWWKQLLSEEQNRLNQLTYNPYLTE